MAERLCLYCEGDNYRDSDFCCDACEDNYHDEKCGTVADQEVLTEIHNTVASGQVS